MSIEYRTTNKNITYHASNRPWPPWAWMLVGFAPGLLLAALVYVDKRNEDIFANKPIDTISILSDGKKTGAHGRPNNNQHPDNNIAGGDRSVNAKSARSSQDNIEFSFFHDLKEYGASGANEKKSDYYNQDNSAYSDPDDDYNNNYSSDIESEKKTRLKLRKSPRSDDDTHSELQLVPENNLMTNTRADKKSLKQFSYLLQVGSFRNKTHALKRKAELLKLGVKSNIDIVKIKSGQWFRVSVGPLNHYQEIRSKIQKIERSAIGVIPIRLKQAGLEHPHTSENTNIYSY